jgi:Sigma-70 region 2
VQPHLNRVEIEMLYREHGRVLLLFAVTIAGDRGRAQDAVHQAFLRMLEAGKLRQIGDAKAYLFASVRNAVLNVKKAQQRNVVLEEEFRVVRSTAAGLRGGTESPPRPGCTPRRSARSGRLARLGRTYVYSDRRDSRHQRKYRGIVLPLCPRQIAPGYVCQGGFLCQFMIQSATMSSSSAI